MRSFLPYWKPHEAGGSEPVTAAFSTFYQQDKVEKGDQLWFVTVLEGRLTLLGTMVVDRVEPSRKAERILNRRLVPDTYYALAKQPAVPRRQVDIHDLALDLRFEGKADHLRPGFTGTHLQRMRRLTPASAAMLQRRWNGESPPQPPDVEDEDATAFPEGRAQYRSHRLLERNSHVVRQKKLAVQQAKGTLACEVCGFDFAEQYGAVGDGYIECHHIQPLSQTGATETRPEDLVLVCANCHRMLHRRRPWLAAADLKDLLAGSR